MATLSSNSRRELLRVAREAVLRAAERRGFHVSPPSDPALLRPGGAFVTLKRGGELRGCIGTFRESDPIYRAVAEMGRAAAAEDPRFPRVTPEEVPELGVEISVLTPLRPVADPAEVEVGRHGVCVVEGVRRGVLLPQVAVEWGWDRETFLDQTCRKAGLPPDAWRHGAQILVFEAEVFGTEHAEEPRAGGGEQAR